jgi:hypothetical protein
MNSTKTLMLATFAALSLGAGTAMAQEAGSSAYTGVDYWAPSAMAARQTQVAGTSQVHSAASPVITLHSVTVPNATSWYNLGAITPPG